MKRRYSIWVREVDSDHEIELCQVDTNPTAITGELHTRQWPAGRRGRRYDTIRIVDNTGEQKHGEQKRGEYTGEQHGEMPRRRKKKPQSSLLSELKAAMAAAHPDRGGSNEAFIAARVRYVAARRSLQSSP
jgi:hypothetical protein